MGIGTLISADLNPFKWPEKGKWLNLLKLWMKLNCREEDKEEIADKSNGLQYTAEVHWYLQRVSPCQLESAHSLQDTNPKKKKKKINIGDNCFVPKHWLHEPPVNLPNQDKNQFYQEWNVSEDFLQYSIISFTQPPMQCNHKMCRGVGRETSYWITDFGVVAVMGMMYRDEAVEKSAAI